MKKKEIFLNYALQLDVPKEHEHVLMYTVRELYSTKCIFDGRNVQHVWQNELVAWKKLTDNSSYPFPKLEISSKQDATAQSIHDLNNPVICQDISWSFDGTSFVTTHSDNGIRQYLVPDDGEITSLVPFKRFFRPQSIISSRINPNYSLFGSNDSNVILVASKELPIQLLSLSADADEHSSLFNYEVQNPENENFETVYAIDYASDRLFLAGSVRNKVSLYDISRKTPIWHARSIKKHCGKSPHRAIVSCFDQSMESIQKTHRYMATYKNDIFLLDMRSQNIQNLKCSFNSDDNPRGVIQILLSMNGHYMYVIKRNSSFIDILDVRNNCERVNRLALPFTIIKQKFKACIDQTNGLSIGSPDGKLLQWTSNIIEFGGIPRSAVEETGTDLAPSMVFQTSYNESRMNVISFNPDMPQMMCVSYSPDKFSEEQNTKSGIAIFEL